MSFYKDTTAVVSPPPHDLVTSHRPHLQILSQWGLEFQQVNFLGGQKYSVDSQALKETFQGDVNLIPSVNSILQKPGPVATHTSVSGNINLSAFRTGLSLME